MIVSSPFSTIRHDAEPNRSTLHLDNSNAQRYASTKPVIRSFACKETQSLFEERKSRIIPPTIQRTALRKLAQLHAVTELQHLAIPPGNHLEALKKDRKGQHSIRVNQQWRVCFIWRADGPHNVEIVDYH